MMRFAQHSALIATTLFAASIYARPHPLPLSYSVVNVDGSQTTPAAVPTTIYATVTDATGSVSTVTVVQTTTTPVVQVAADPTETALIPEVSGYTVSSVAEAAPTPPPWAAWVGGEQPPASPSTVTTTAFATIEEAAEPTTTSYYDDGMWHTTYAVKDFSSSYVPSGSVAPALSTGAMPWKRAAPTGNGGWSAGSWNQTNWHNAPKLAPRMLASGYGAAAPTGYGW